MYIFLFLSATRSFWPEKTTNTTRPSLASRGIELGRALFDRRSDGILLELLIAVNRTNKKIDINNSDDAAEASEARHGF